MKKVRVVILALLASLVLAGCQCKHEWTPANCTTAKTCSKCGEVEGEPLGHKWMDATCIRPMVCSACGEVTGEALGHTWQDATCTKPMICSKCYTTSGKALGHTIEEWSVVSESTCSEGGVEAGTCTVCGKTVEQKLPLKEHTPGDWVITVEPTETNEGTRVKLCEVCNQEVEREKFSLSAEEIKDRYIKSCKTISYKDLARTPDQYKGERIKFSGNVVQVCSEGESDSQYAVYRVATSGRYDNVVYIYLDKWDYLNLGKRILEDDRITFYGVFSGLITYETVLGANITIPSMKVEYVD